MGTHYDYGYRGDPHEFMRRVGAIPNLKSEEEVSLINAYRDRGDQRALSSLYAAHQKLIVQLVKKARLMPSFGDALGAANIGLHKAIEKFDVERGFRLNTYAKWWINAELSELYGKTSIVKLGTSPDDKKARTHLGRVLHKVVMPGKDPTEDDFKEIARRLGVPVKSVEMAYYGAYVGDVSIDNTFTRGGDNFDGLHETLSDKAPLQDEVLEQLDHIEEMRSHLKRAIEYLDERELVIFKARRMEDPPRTLEDLSYVFNISRERVRQLEVKAFNIVYQVVHDGPTEEMVEKWDERQKQAHPKAVPA